MCFVINHLVCFIVLSLMSGLSSPLFQATNLLNIINVEVNLISSGSIKVSQMIINTLADILKLQTTSTLKEGRKQILKRGIDKFTILNADSV